MRPGDSAEATVRLASNDSTRVQQRAGRYGIAGVDGNAGIVESVTCRTYWILWGSNPTLSANIYPYQTLI